MLNGRYPAPGAVIRYGDFAYDVGEPISTTATSLTIYS